MMNDLPFIRPVLHRYLCSLWAPALLLILTLAAPAVQAQVVINVTTTTDELNNNNGACSLREAIEETRDFNAASEGDCTDDEPNGSGFVINLPASTYTLSLAGGLDLAPTDGFGFGVPLTIRASGGGSAIIDANGIDRVFDLQLVGNGFPYSVTFENLVITGGNTSGNGGAIHADAQRFSTVSIDLVNTHVTGNTAGGDGGAFFLEGHRLTATRSTIDTNTASGNGGALYVTDGDVTLTNTTVSGNSATSGGAFYLDNSAVQISQSTIYDNSGSGVHTTNNASVDYKNTILAGNTGGDCTGTVDFDSHGYNLIEGFTGGCNAGYSEEENAGTDITDTDPLLEALALNNGNGTAVQWPTHRLMDSSPAVDQADGTTVAGSTVTTDARGATRPYDHAPVANAANGSDIGAFEAQADELPSAPVANDDAYDVDEGQTLTVNAPGVLDNDTDADGDLLTAVLDTDVANGTLVLNTDGSFTYTPDAGFAGTDTFTYHANDGTNDSNVATVTITVNDINFPPVANDDAYNVDEGQTLTVNAPGVLGNDTDGDGDPLTATLVSDASDGTLTLNADGSFTYTPDAHFSGTDTFSYQANDGTANSNVATVTITVNDTNDVPVANNDAYVVAEDQPLTIFPPGVLANDTDPDGDALTAVLVSGVSNGSFTLEENGAFTYIPITGFSGTDSFTYQASDGLVTSNVATVTITVDSFNEAPVANDDGYTVNEGQTLTIAVPGVLGNDTDADGDVLTTTLVSNASNGTLVLNADGSFTYTPDANFNGTDTFSYQANDGIANANVATVTITVVPVNDAPVAKNDEYTTGEGEPLAVTPPGVLTNDTDPDGDALTATLVSDVSDGTLVLNADGSFSYMPDANFSGTDTFSYQANDGTASSNVATVTIRVGATNDPPVATDDGYVLDEDQTLTVLITEGVLANDADADGDALTATLVSDASDGTLVLNADGSFTYTPDAHFSGTDTFTYQANDGTVNSNVAEVALLINAMNDAPVAVDDAASTPSHVPVTIAVLANDTDVDGTLDPASVQVEDAPTSGTATVNTGTGEIVFDPGNSFQGAVTFTYTVADDQSARSAAATVTVAVQNRPPIAIADTASTLPGMAVVIDVLANDSDPEAGPLALEAVSTPANGTATIHGNGTITYTPGAGFSGDDTFTYTVRDEVGSTASAEVVITITCLFDIVDLGTLGGTASRAFDISEAGEVVGISETEAGKVQGFLWSGGLPMPLGADRISQALGIDEGIVGAAQVDNVLRAVQLSGGSVNDLNAPAEAFSVAFGTQGNQAVGTYVEGDVFFPFAVRGGFTMLEVPGGGGGQALAVNAAGQVVGFSMAEQALVWQATGEATVLGSGRAFGINAAGQIVGTSGGQAVRWEPDGTPLPLDPGGVGFAEAYDINEAGAVVGTAVSAAKQDEVLSWHTARDLLSIVQAATSAKAESVSQAAKGTLQGGAYLWQGGIVTDLNTCLGEGSGWVLEEARAINNLGQIVGYGIHGGVQRAFLLTPRGNTAPTAKNDRVVTEAMAPVRIDLLTNDLDADGDTLRVLRVFPPTAGTITTAADGSVMYQPQEGFTGEDRFLYSATDGHGAADHAEVIVEVKAPIEQPTQYALDQNYPNPFNPSTTIRYALPEPGRVRIIVYNILGQHIRTLVEEPQDAGVYTTTFEAHGLPSGVYFYRLEIEDRRLVRQMTLIR